MEFPTCCDVYTTLQKKKKVKSTCHSCAFISSQKFLLMKQVVSVTKQRQFFSPNNSVGVIVQVLGTKWSTSGEGPWGPKERSQQLRLLQRYFNCSRLKNFPLAEMKWVTTAHPFPTAALFMLGCSMDIMYSRCIHSFSYFKTYQRMEWQSLIFLDELSNCLGIFYF